MRIVFLALAALPCFAQKLHVYSPLTRIDPSGQVVKQDRGSAEPRHILSPGFPRNAYSSLRVVVELDKPEGYFLDIGQNPENAVKATLYREIYTETPSGFVPDALQPVSIPYRGFPTDFHYPGQRVVTFWLDMWVDRNAPVDRVKVEPQLYVDSVQDWIVYPMEVRIQQPVVPAHKPASWSLPSPVQPADAVAYEPLRSALCSASAPASKPEPTGAKTGRQLMLRNVAQHLALIRDTAAAQAHFAKAAGVDLKTWCAKPSTPPRGPEWYLRFRDLIYRQAGASD
jgi:hypothetical protein